MAKKKKSTKEIMRELENYQSGRAVNNDADIAMPTFGGGELGDRLSADMGAHYEANPVVPLTPMERSADIYAGMRSNRGYRDDTVAALNAGFGTSKYDVEFNPFEDLNEKRALNQSGGRQILFGLLNGGVKAAATAVNSSLGVLYGLVNGLANLGGDPNKGFWEGFVNNDVADTMQDVIDWGREVAPRYLTQEEQSDEYQKRWWYPSHMFRANFLADFLDNFGFTIGSIGAGAAVGKMLSTAMRTHRADKFIKAITKAAKGDKEADKFLKSVKEAIDKGTVQTINSERFAPELEKLARKMYYDDIITQSVTGAISASGEGVAEGLMAKREWMDEFRTKAAQDYEERYDRLESDILNSGDSRFIDYIQYNGTDIPVLSEEGVNELKRRQQEEDKRYRELMQQADIEGDNLAATTTILNLPVLFANNLFMYSRLLRGGWKTSRNVERATRGKVSGGVEMAEGEKGALNLKGNFTPKKKSVTGRGWKKIGETAGSESLEEMLQGGISTGAKRVADIRLSEFNDDGYDREARSSVADWFRGMGQGFGEFFGDVKNWQEGFLGALTGILGIPGKRWTGGIPGAFREAREEVNASKDAANKLNSLVNSKEFQDRWQGYIRHLKYDQNMDAAIQADDEYTWRNEDQKQIISDIIAFAQEGRLNDLYDIVEAFGNITEERAQDIKKAVQNEDNPQAEWTRNHQPGEIVKAVRDKANDIKELIDSYKKIYDAIRMRAPQNVSDEFMNELVFTAMNINQFEKRFIELLGEVLNGVAGEHRGLKSAVRAGTAFDDEGKPIDIDSDNAKSNYEAAIERIERRLGSLNPNGLSYDGASSNEDVINSIVDIMEDAALMKSVKEVISKDSLLHRKFTDLMNIAQDRQAYYKKLATLQKVDGPSKFAQSMQTQEKEEQTLEQEHIQNETKSRMDQLREATNLKDFARIYRSFNLDDDSADKNNLDTEIMNDDSLKDYFDEIIKAQQVKDGMEDDLDNYDNKTRDFEDVRIALEGIDIMDAVRDFDSDDVDPVVALGTELLKRLEGNDEAQKIAKALIEGKLDDIDKSESLGTVPETPVSVAPESVTPESATEPAAGEEPESQPEFEPEKPSSFPWVKSIIDNTSNPDSNKLNGYINGIFDSSFNLTDQEMAELADLATKRKKMLQDIYSQSVNKEQSNAAEEQVRITVEENNETSNETYDKDHIDGNSTVSVWDIFKMKKGAKVPYKASSKDVQATIDWYVAHHVQEFLDSGALAELEELYRNQGKRLPIYLLGNPHYIENNAENNPFAKEGTRNVLFAIEVNDENMKVLEKYPGLVTADTTVEVFDKNGNSTRYQVIGQLDNPRHAKNVKTEADKMWEAAMRDSIDKQYAGDSKATMGNMGRLYVARDADENRITTTLNYHMSGRNWTKTDPEEKYKKKSLSKSMKEYRDFYKKKYYFGIQTKSNDFVKDPLAPPFPAEVYAPYGSLWMATQQANGTWSWTYITIKRGDEFDFEANKDTKLVKTIYSAIDAIFAPSRYSSVKEDRDADFGKRVEQIKILNDLIYLGEGNTFSLVYTKEGPKMYVGGELCSSRQDVLDKIKEHKYRFQVSTEDISYKPAMDMLIDAGVLESEMESFMRMGSKFGVNPLSASDDYSGTVNTDTPSGTPAERPLDSTRDNIRIGSNGYRLNEDGSVVRMGAMGRSGEPVTDLNIIAQVKALYTVRNKNGKAYPGLAWIIDNNNMQYTEMYEQEVDGIFVRIVKRGRNGAFLPVYNDQQWNDLMEVAQPFNENAEYYAVKSTQDSGSQTTIYKGRVYTVRDGHIFNANGVEVFKADAANAGADRNKILANAAVSNNTAKVVEHNGNKYVVMLETGDIISVKTGRKMMWGNENGDRKAILRSAGIDVPESVAQNSSVENTNSEVEQKPERKRRKPGVVSDLSVPEGPVESNGVTAQEKDQKDSKTEDEVDCG